MHPSVYTRLTYNYYTKHTPGTPDIPTQTRGTPASPNPKVPKPIHKTTRPSTPSPIRGTVPSASTPNKTETPTDKTHLTPAQGKSRYVGLMRPRGIALRHPAAPLLQSYATTGCPVDCGRPWTKEELTLAVQKGPHPSAKTQKAILACRKEALERVRDNCCRLVKWSTLLRQLPQNLKISPIAAIPHKSRDYRMILDLSYKLNK